MPDILKDTSMQTMIGVMVAIIAAFGSLLQSNSAKDIATSAQLSTSEVRRIYEQRGSVDAKMLAMDTAIKDLQGRVHREQTRRDEQLKERSTLEHQRFAALQHSVDMILEADKDRSKSIDERIAKIGELLVNILGVVRLKGEDITKP